MTRGARPRAFVAATPCRLYAVGWGGAGGAPIGGSGSSGRKGDAPGELDGSDAARLARAAAAGNVRQVRELLEGMRLAKVPPSVSVWRHVIQAHLRAFDLDAARAVLAEMRSPRNVFGRAIEPDASSYEIIINACADAGDADCVAALVREMEAHGLGDAAPYATLVRVRLRAADPSGAEAVLSGLVRARRPLHAGLVRQVLEAALQTGDEAGCVRLVRLWSQQPAAAANAEPITALLRREAAHAGSEHSRLAQRLLAAMPAGAK